MGFEASFKAEMAKREVSQFAVQPRVLVRRVRDCAGGRARYGSRLAGVRLRWEEAIVGGYFELWFECKVVNCTAFGQAENISSQEPTLVGVVADV